MLKIPAAAARICALAMTMAAFASNPVQAADSGRESGIGINASNLSALSRNQPGDAGRYFDMLSQSGVGWIRIATMWRQLEPAPGQYNWTVLDGEVDALRARHLDILLNVFGTPCWARADQAPPCYAVATHAHHAGSQLPVRAQWQAFISGLVARYRGRIAYYEIWNEANNSASLDVNGAASDSPQQLTAYRDQILIPAAEAVHRTDPAARVVGPVFTPFETSTVDDLAAKFAILLGGGAPQAIDVVSIHIYPASRLIAYGQGVRQAMHAAGMDGKPLWLTEFGHPAGADLSRVDEQKNYLLEFLRDNNATHVFDKVFWYSMGDNDLFGGGWATHVRDGLINDDLTPRPAYTALQDYIRTGTLSAMP
jgi:hypothetical protein